MGHPQGQLWEDPSQRYFGSFVYYGNQNNSDFICCIPIELLSEILVKAEDYMTNTCLKSARVDDL